MGLAPVHPGVLIMTIQHTQAMARKSGLTLERVLDQLGVLFLLALGLSTAGATLLVGF